MLVLGTALFTFRGIFHSDVFFPLHVKHSHCCALIYMCIYTLAAMMYFHCPHHDTMCRRVKGPKGKSKSAYLEQYRRASIDSIATVPKSQQIRQMSSPSELETVPMTPNSNKQQSDLDLTMLNERRGNSTSLVP